MVARADALFLAQPFGTGRGIIDQFSIAAPGAGNQFSRTTAQGYWERVIALSFVFTTSAAVGNRIVAVAITDADGNILGGGVAGAVQAASLGQRFYCAPILGQSPPAGVGRATVSLPWVYLQPGWRLQSDIGALDAGDTITLIRGVVERFGIGPDGTPVGETELPYTERGRGYARALESE